MPEINYLDLQLQNLLQLHDQSFENRTNQTLTVPVVLGDGFLFLNNPIYQKIRKEYLSLGFKLTGEDFCDYDVLPYASLSLILEKKKVPFKDNVSVFRRIEKDRPGHFKIGDIPKVKSNYLLHEASHCIADSILKKLNPLAAKNSLTPDQQRIFPFLLVESFANSVESMANAYNDLPEAKLFYDLNSYVTHEKKIDTALRRCLESFGEKTTFSVIYLSYLCANLLLPEPSTKQLHALFLASGFSEMQSKKILESPHARKLFMHGFELNLDFRIQTTGFFCATLGIDTPLEKLLNIDLIDLLKKTNCVKSFISHTQFLFSK